MRKPRLLVGVATAALLLGMAGPSAALGVVPPLGSCTFAAADSSYYNGPNVSDGQYASGPLTFSWLMAAGTVTSGEWTEISPPFTGPTYHNVIASGTVVGTSVNMTTAPRLSPPDGYTFTIQGALVGGVFTGTAAGNYLLTATGTVTCVPITALSPAKIWVGLKNSDDVGLKVDLQAVVKLNSDVVSTGVLLNVATGSSGFNNAKLNTIIFPVITPVVAGTGDVLSITLSVRNICGPGSHNSGTARLWFNGALIDTGTTRDAGSRFDATIAPSATSSNYFLRTPTALSTTAGSSRTFVDMAAGAKCDPTYKSFGTWSTTLP